nr:MAG TPA: hypothetical protein [Caudoviricetes sp.]
MQFLFCHFACSPWQLGNPTTAFLCFAMKFHYNTSKPRIAPSMPFWRRVPASTAFRDIFIRPHRNIKHSFAEIRLKIPLQAANSAFNLESHLVAVDLEQMTISLTLVTTSDKVLTSRALLQLDPLGRNPNQNERRIVTAPNRELIVLLDKPDELIEGEFISTGLKIGHISHKGFLLPCFLLRCFFAFASFSPFSLMVLFSLTILLTPIILLLHNHHYHIIITTSNILFFF